MDFRDDGNKFSGILTADILLSQQLLDHQQEIWSLIK
jgi:hypothetical protein